MLQNDTIGSSSSSGTAGIPRFVGPRTFIGSKRVRIGDLVLVDSANTGGERLGLVCGGYQLGSTWYVQLAPAPGHNGQRAALPQSVKARYIRRAWYRRGRPA